MILDSGWRVSEVLSERFGGSVVKPDTCLLSAVL